MEELSRKEVLEELESTQDELRKKYTILFLEELLKRAVEDGFYVKNCKESISHEHKITFELISDKAYIIEEFYKRPWWKFWER
tara:strand:- start:64 stop:312 length:249 start_codon:yes stop_codon:yes gene_type:complete